MLPARPLRHALGTAVLVFGLAMAGCTDSGNRVYTAASYSAGTGCLQDYAPLGLVVAGDLPASCDPTCLNVAGGVYVSTVCPPFPAEAVVVDPSNTDCQNAIAELDAGAFCSLAAGATYDAGVDGSDDAPSE